MEKQSIQIKGHLKHRNGLWFKIIYIAHLVIEMVFSKSTKQFLHFSRWNHTWLEGRKLTSYSKWSGDIPWFFSEQLLSDITSARKVKRKLVSRWNPKMSQMYNNKSLMSWYLAYHKWKRTQNDNCTSNTNRAGFIQEYYCCL